MTPATGDEDEVPGVFADRPVLRRAAGAGTVAVLSGALVGWFAAPIWLATCVCVVVLGVPLSFLVERRRPSTRVGRMVLRHAGLGVTIAVVVAAAWVISIVSSGLGDASFALVFLVAAGPVAAVVAAVTAWIAVTLPSRLLAPAVAVGLLATAAAAVVNWEAARPPEPFDYILVGPRADPSLGSAIGLADVVRDEIEQQADAGSPRLAHATWVAASDAVFAGSFQGAAAEAAFDAELQRRRSDGTEVRLITTGVGDERACVVVTAEATEVAPERCAALPLVDDLA